MKKIILIIAVVLFTNFSFAQNDLGKLDDVGKISLTPVLPASMSNLPDEAKNMLLNKLQQIVTKNGMGGVAIDPNFIITATIDVESKDITSTAPPMIAMKLNINMYVIDYQNQTTLAEVSTSVKGVGKTEEKAYIEGIKTINVKSTSYKKLITTGKEKIVEYYNTNCDVLMKKAQALSSQEKYEEAISLLMSVPEVCMECYSNAMDAVGPIHKLMVSENCNQYLDAAKAAWLNNDLETARRNLVLIEPGTKCYDSGVELAKKINTESGNSSSNTQNDAGGAIQMRKTGDPAPAKAVEENAKEIAVKNKTTADYNVDFIK